MAAVRERLLAAIQGSAVTITDFVWYGGEASRENIAAWQRTRQWQQQI